MIFDHLLARADDAVLQDLLGAPTLRLLNALDPTLRQPSKLKEVLVGLYSREGLLDDASRRASFIDLLRDHEARQLLTLLAGPTSGNPFEQLRSVRIARGSTREQTFYAFFGLQAPDRSPVRQSPPAATCAPGYALFPHQRQAARKVSAVLRAPGGRVLLHMPTGSGKTRTAMSALADHLRTTEPGLVIWLAYSEELCDQAAQEFERAWAAIGDRPVQVHRFWGDRTLDLERVRDGVLIAGLSKIASLAKQSLYAIGQLGSRCTLLVLDEAHQAIAPTYRLIIDALLVHAHAPSFLGLSATPGRTWSDIDQDRALADFFNRQKVILEIEGYPNPVAYLEAEGYLARAQMLPLFVRNGFTLTAADLRRLEDELDLPPALLKRLADDEQRNLAIVHRTEQLLRDHRRVLLFATTVQHSALIATVLQARGVRALSVTGASPDDERARAITSFRDDSPEPMVLCNYGVLTTGFDAPRTSAVVIARPTKSLVLYSQMVGRAIRGPRAGGNATADVVTVVDSTLPGFGTVADAFMNWEDVWE